MGLRFAAVLTAAVLAIAAIAAFLANHHSPVGSVPASQDKNVKAYVAMVTADYGTMNQATSNNCNAIQDQTCAAAVQRLVPALRKWVDDLNAATTPPRLAVLDHQLRLHLNEAIVGMNEALAFQRANDANGFYLAMGAVVYQRAWMDPTTFEIEGTYPRAASTFRDAISIDAQSIHACVGGTPAPADLGCSRLVTGQTCTGVEVQVCEGDVEAAEAQIESFLIGLAQNTPPASLASKTTQLEDDLAKADINLLAITDDLIRRDAVKATTDQNQFANNVLAADGHVSVLPGGV